MPQFEIPCDQIQKMQRVGLEMVRFFDAFCRKEGLTYFLCGGCCIGAVRTGGFIPWDDDVDLFMPREDYEKLKLVWVNTDRYTIQYPTLETPTANQFLTIHDVSTTFIKSYQKDLDICHGIAMDVLPIDGCPTGLRRKLQKLWALTYSLFVVGKAPTNHGNAVTDLGKLLLWLVRSGRARYAIWRFCEKKMSAYPISQCKYITELCSGPHYMQNEYPAAAFSKAEYVPFENLSLPIPADYDIYLRMAFGDYRKLPPVEKRVCHHEYEVLDTEHSYLEYRGSGYLEQTEKRGAECS